MYRTNPFSIRNNVLFVDSQALCGLHDQEIMTCFVDCIDSSYPNRKEHHEMVYMNCVNILEQSLRLNIYQDKSILFARIFEKLFVTLSR